MPRRSIVLPCLLALALLGGACSDDAEPEGGQAGASEEDAGGTAGGAGSEEQVTVGSGASPASRVVGALYAEALTATDHSVTRRLGYGERGVVLAALEAGDLDVAPDRAGPLAVSLGADVDATSDLAEVEAELAGALPDGLVALEASEADSTSVLVATRETVDERGLESIEDLAAATGDLVVGGRDGLPAAPAGTRFLPLDEGGPLTKEALVTGEVDVAVLASTDGAIRANDWVVLDGDPRLDPAGNLVAVVREEALDEEARAVVAEVNRSLGDGGLRVLVERVTVLQEDAEEVARDWAEDTDLYETVAREVERAFG